MEKCSHHQLVKGSRAQYAGIHLEIGRVVDVRVAYLIKTPSGKELWYAASDLEEFQP